MSPVRQYEIKLSPVFHDLEETYSARSRSAARYQCYLRFTDCCPDLTFREFLREVESVRVTSHRTPSAYEYVRSVYGLDVSVGQRVRLPKGEAGVIAEPGPDCGPYVRVFVDGEAHSGLYHPSDVEASSEKA